MKSDASFISFVLDQLDALGDVTPRSMFGGVGLYHRGLFFGIIAGDTLYLKLGDAKRAERSKGRSKPFNPFPDRAGKTKYHSVPVDVLESAPALVEWARTAVAVARS